MHVGEPVSLKRGEFGSGRTWGGGERGDGEKEGKGVNMGNGWENGGNVGECRKCRTESGNLWKVGAHWGNVNKHWGKGVGNGNSLLRMEFHKCFSQEDLANEALKERTSKVSFKYIYPLQSNAPASLNTKNIFSKYFLLSPKDDFYFFSKFGKGFILDEVRLQIELALQDVGPQK